MPPAQRAGWGSFIKSCVYRYIRPASRPASERAADNDDAGRLAGFSGDLYSMTAPPFILSPISLTGAHVPHIPTALPRYRSHLLTLPYSRQNSQRTGWNDQSYSQTSTMVSMRKIAPFTSSNGSSYVSPPRLAHGFIY